MSEQFVHRNRVATVATIAEGCSKSVASWTVASRSGASGTGASGAALLTSVVRRGFFVLPECRSSSRDPLVIP